MWHSAVPVLVRSDRLRQRLVQFSWPAEVELLVFSETADLANLPEPCGVFLVEDQVLRESSIRSALAACLLRARTLRCISVFSTRPLFLRSLAGRGRVAGVPPDAKTLPERVMRMKLQSWRDRMVSRIRAARYPPFLLREALVLLLRQGVSEDFGHRLRTVTAVAERLGVRRETLSRLSSAHRIQIPDFADACLIVGVLSEAAIAKTPWVELSIRLGYAWQSGLVELVKRGLGVAPGEAKHVWLGNLARWWETTALVPALQSTSMRNTDLDHTG